MKTLLTFIVILFSMGFCMAIDNLPPDIKQSLFDNLQVGLQSFLGMINWLYVIVFIIISWLINDATDAENKFMWLSWYGKIPKVLRSLVFGILLIGIFYWAFNYTTRIEVINMLFSLLASMILYKFGIDKILRFISERLGLKFEI